MTEVLGLMTPGRWISSGVPAPGGVEAARVGGRRPLPVTRGQPRCYGVVTPARASTALARAPGQRYRRRVEVIRTERLLLRPWSRKDVADLVAYAGDPEWGRYLPVPQPYA